MKNAFDLIYILIYIILVSTAQLILKTGVSLQTPTASLFHYLLMSITNIRIILGLVLYGISFLVWLIILDKMEISFAYPLLSLSVVIVSVISWLHLNESFSMMRLIGILVTLLGCYFVVKS